jgi:galactokinase
MVTVGRVFREDGHGLRDVYQISGPELETMCDIVRTVPGVLGTLRPSQVQAGRAAHG